MTEDPEASAIRTMNHHSHHHYYNKSGQECTSLPEYLYQNQSDWTLHPAAMLTFSVVYSLLITVGVVGNLLVVISVARHRSLQSVRNVFIVSLSCSDIVVSTVSGSITPISAFSKVWLFGSQLCSLVPLIQGASLCFSTFTLTAIAIDRFILIIFPTKKPIQQRHAIRMVAMNVALAASISLPMSFNSKLQTVADFCGEICTENWQSEAHRKQYGMLVFVVQFVAPFAIITFCYTMISFKLGKSVLLRDASCKQSEQRRQALRRRLRTNRMLIAMVSVFVGCWTPHVAYNLARDFDCLPAFVTGQPYFFGLLMHCVAMSSTVWNPALYALLNEQFRLAFQQLLPSSCWRRFSSGADSISSSSSGSKHRKKRLWSRASRGYASTLHRSSNLDTLNGVKRSPSSALLEVKSSVAISNNSSNNTAMIRHASATNNANGNHHNSNSSTTSNGAGLVLSGGPKSSSDLGSTGPEQVAALL